MRKKHSCSSEGVTETHGRARLVHELLSSGSEVGGKAGSTRACTAPSVTSKTNLEMSPDDQQLQSNIY